MGLCAHEECIVMGLCAHVYASVKCIIIMTLGL